MIRRPPRSTLDRSSAASDVYKRQGSRSSAATDRRCTSCSPFPPAVSYTHLRAHETGRNLVCRLLLEKKKNNNTLQRYPETPRPERNAHPTRPSHRDTRHHC